MVREKLQWQGPLEEGDQLHHHFLVGWERERVRERVRERGEGGNEGRRESEERDTVEHFST